MGKTLEEAFVSVHTRLLEFIEKELIPACENKEQALIYRDQCIQLRESPITRLGATQMLLYNHNHGILEQAIGQKMDELGLMDQNLRSKLISYLHVFVKITQLSSSIRT